MLSDSAKRKAQRLNGAFDPAPFASHHDYPDNNPLGAMNSSPTPREMGHQLAVQLLQAFGTSADAVGDASEALAHAQMWICDMRKTGRTGIGSAGIGAQSSLLSGSSFAPQMGAGGLLGASMLGTPSALQQSSLLSNLQAQQFQAAAAASYMSSMDGHGHGHGGSLGTSMQSKESEQKGGRIKTPHGVKYEDWKDRPSDFLREYGDPGAAHGDRRPPTAGVNGNWECPSCGNINFPRRTNCLRCHTGRDEAGEKIVQEYVKQIIENGQR